MSKKDYQLIARAIFQTLSESDREGRSALMTCATRIANACGDENPRFDRQRFLEVCETGKCKGMKK